jgi:hypothetical protein
VRFATSLRPMPEPGLQIAHHYQVAQKLESEVHWECQVVAHSCNVNCVQARAGTRFQAPVCRRPPDA